MGGANNWTKKIFYYNGLRKIKFNTQPLKYKTLVPQPHNASGHKLNWFNVNWFNVLYFHEHEQLILQNLIVLLNK